MTINDVLEMTSRNGSGRLGGSSRLGGSESVGVGSRKEGIRGAIRGSGRDESGRIGSDRSDTSIIFTTIFALNDGKN